MDCSIIYPNTNAQIIVIWDDEINYRTPSMLLVGVHLKKGRKVFLKFNLINGAQNRGFI
jgi:hypothetical protein